MFALEDLSDSALNEGIFKFNEGSSTLTTFNEDLDKAKGLFRWSILYMFGVCLLLVISRLPLAIMFNDQLLALITDFSMKFAFI